VDARAALFDLTVVVVVVVSVAVGDKSEDRNEFSWLFINLFPKLMMSSAE
jgi:hypothetical protein